MGIFQREGKELMLSLWDDSRVMFVLMAKPLRVDLGTHAVDILFNSGPARWASGAVEIILVGISNAAINETDKIRDRWQEKPLICQNIIHAENRTGLHVDIRFVHSPASIGPVKTRATNPTTGSAAQTTKP